MAVRARGLVCTVLLSLAVLVALLVPALVSVTPATAQDAETEDTDAADDEAADDEAPDDEPADDESPSVLFGTLRTQDGPVEGVELTISDDGGELGTVTSSDTGQWEFEVPEAGEYEVSITTLPDDVALRTEDGGTTTATVAEGARQAVGLPLGEGAAVSGRVALALQQTLSGIRFGLINAITAVGLSLIFGTTGLINFAHRETVVFGGIVAWFLNAAGLHLALAGLIAIVATGIFSGSLDRGIFRPLRRRRVGLFQMLVVTIGLSLIVRFTLLIIFGGGARPYNQYVISNRIELGPFTTTTRDLVVIAICVVALVGVATALQKSRLGKAMRAVSDNRDLAESSGIDVERVVSVVWIAGGMLAGLGGVLYGTLFRVDYLFGFQPMLLLMFAGIILGGLGTAYGAMLGSIVVGLVIELSVVFFPNELKTAWALIALVIVLLVRPQGLLGRRERIG